MKSKKIVVVGSTNMDMVIKTTHIPKQGETVLGGTFFMNPGGKGANQAVAVSRLGGNVIFISKTGNDLFGKKSFQILSDEGMDTQYVFPDDHATSGIALITVDQGGENSIVVAPGANANLLPRDIESALSEIGKAGIVLMQLEIPMETIQFIAEYASSNGITLILNPAPAQILPADLLSRIDIITPNETEASIISGIDVKDMESAMEAGKIIQSMGVKNVVITMGSLGAIICFNDQSHVVYAQKAETLDSTAAGDVFNGALAVLLAEGNTLIEAVEFACDAATISVTRLGAQTSIPYRHEVIQRNLAIQSA